MAAKEDCESMNFKNVSSDFKRVINYLEAQRELMDAHMVDYFTSNHWETLLPRQIREDLESLSHQELASLPTACYHESEQFGENLKQFLTEANLAQLNSFSWLKDRKEFSSECKISFISHIMTPKKSYEVEIMSNAVHRLATQFDVSKILDLGSGKGYLSQYLALQYGLKVIGVDSSISNTQNAVKRNERLLKAWDGLVKKSQKEKIKHLSNIGKKEILSTKYTASLHSCNGDDNNENTSALKQTKYSIGVGDTTLPSDLKYQLHDKTLSLKADSSSLSSSSESWNHNVNVSHVSSSLPFTYEEHPEVAEIKGAHAINMMQDGCHYKKKQFAEHNVNAAISDSKQSLNANPNSFLPITGFVDQSFVANGELRKLFDELMSSHADSSTESNELFLVGLHTCGDLVPMALRIFVNEPSVKLICIVGCCYHLVSQEFGSGSSCTSDDPGFPMSQFLKPFRLRVSRNATMVAQQAADRIASQSKCPPPSVLFRAILQVILKEKFGLDGRGMHVGKAGAKCKDFKEYVHKCLHKLGLQDRITELSDEEVESYHERFKSQEKQLHAFHQLRAAIAPCIESVFLLDRLCYLHEQGFKSACIVRLFDPVKSPRCYAIIASKD